jgi:hypothetical protein
MLRNTALSEQRGTGDGQNLQNGVLFWALNEETSDCSSDFVFGQLK